MRRDFSAIVCRRHEWEMTSENAYVAMARPAGPVHNFNRKRELPGYRHDSPAAPPLALRLRAIANPSGDRQTAMESARQRSNGGKSAGRKRLALPARITNGLRVDSQLREIVDAIETSNDHLRSRGQTRDVWRIKESMISRGSKDRTFNQTRATLSKYLSIVIASMYACMNTRTRICIRVPVRTSERAIATCIRVNERSAHVWAPTWEKPPRPMSSNWTERSPVMPDCVCCLFGLTVKLALTHGRHQDYKDFGKSRR